MTKVELIKSISNFCGEKEATAIADEYTDKEIEEHGKEIISDLAEEYRFCANVSRYRECGY